MAILLVRTIDNTNPTAKHPGDVYMTGDVVQVFPDNHVFGRLEDPAVWVAEGNAIEDFPEGYEVVKVPGIPMSALEHLQLEQKDHLGAMTARRNFTLDTSAPFDNDNATLGEIISAQFQKV